MKKRIIFSFVLITLLFSCDTSMDEMISTEDLLLGKWQLKSYIEDGETPNDISSCELLRTLDFLDNELIVDEYGESAGGLSCVLEFSTSINYFVKNNVIKTSFLDFIIDEITTSELHLKIFIEEDNETIIVKEKYTKIN